MTLTAEPVVATTASVRPGSPVRWPADVAVGATLATWATFLVWGTGGREPHHLSVAIAFLIAAWVLVRPWRVLRLDVQLVLHAIAAGAFAVVATAPTGWAGADDAASYAYAAELALLLLAWSRTGNRRVAVMLTVVAAGGLEFAHGWLAWWGGQDATRPFLGTFYWHNQAGIFLAGAALLAFGCAVRSPGPVAMLGWVAGPLCAAGAVFSTSRGSEGALALGVLLLGASCLFGSSRLRRTARLLGIVAASWVVSFVLTGPPFFPHRLPPAAGTAVRAAQAGGNAEQNGIQRLDDWRRATAVFRHWPISGAGFHSFSSAAAAVTTKRDAVTTAFAHNGYLQALADGGVVLALPLFAALAVALVVAFRALPRALRQGDPVLPVALCGLVALLLHSGMDFDWSYPALLSLTALVGVLSVSRRVDGVDDEEDMSLRHRRLRTVSAFVGLVALGVSAVGAWHGGLDLNTSIAGVS